jgi:hypothetical protein
MRSATSERRSDRWLERLRSIGRSANSSILSCLGTSRCQIGSGGLGVLVPPEMFGARHRIQIAKPFRRAPVRLVSFDHPDEAATGVLVTFAR